MNSDYWNTLLTVWFEEAEVYSEDVAANSPYVTPSPSLEWLFHNEAIMALQEVHRRQQCNR